MIDQGPRSQIVDSTLQELKVRLNKDELELNEIIKLLRQIDLYLDKKIVNNKHFQLNQHFIENFKKKLMKEFNAKDAQLINNCYKIFLNPIND